MIANIVNTLLGIYLVYAAVLNPALMAGPFRVLAPAAGALIVLLALVARRSDYHPWHASVTTFLGAALILLGAWNVFVPTALVVNYWSAFWVGVLTAFVCLWAAIYRPLKTGV